MARAQKDAIRLALRLGAVKQARWLCCLVFYLTRVLVSRTSAPRQAPGWTNFFARSHSLSSQLRLQRAILNGLGEVMARTALYVPLLTLLVLLSALARATPAPEPVPDVGE